MAEEKDLEVNVDCFGIQFFGEDRMWGPVLELSNFLSDDAKKVMRHTSFRFVLYGQFGSPSLVPQPGQPEHERFPGATEAKTP
jgi:hypothetical protein